MIDAKMVSAALKEVRQGEKFLIDHRSKSLFVIALGEP